MKQVENWLITFNEINSNKSKISTISLPNFYSPNSFKKIENEIILIKVGGNAITDESIKKGITESITELKNAGALPIVVHGGGPVIRKMLELAQIESEFVEGHRVTTAEAMEFTEMALSGNVNGELVSLINHQGGKAVGLSGKDGGMVTAVKRMENQEIDLGFVGNVEEINSHLVHLLLSKNYIPVISPVSSDKNGDTYNINADMFAGHMAGALKATHYVALTDVDGILTDKMIPLPSWKP